MKLGKALAIWIFSVTNTAVAVDSNQDLFELSLKQLTKLQINDIETHAEKWQSNSIDLPFSISFLKPYNYYNPNLNSIDDIDHHFSSLVVTEYNKVTPQLYIRGIGSNSSGAGDDPSVAYLIDGINIARPGFHNPILFDVKQVEVIKGPQGSLYGKSVIGGAINLVPNSPVSESYTRLAGTIKERGWDFQAINNSIINDHTTNRISVVSEDIKGYATNHETNQHPGEEKNLAVRDQVVWSGNNKKLTVLIEYNKQESLDPVYSYFGEEPLNNLAATDLTPFRNNAYNIQAPKDSSSERDFYFTSIKYDLASSYGRWVSTTSFNKGDYDFNLVFLPINFLPTTNLGDEQAWQANQEIRFEKEHDKIRWSFGVYLSYENIERNETFNLLGLTHLFGFDFALTPDTPGFTLSVAEQNTTNNALFFHSRWEFLKDWNITTGLRSDYVTKDFELSVSGGDPFNIGLVNSEDFTIDTDKSWRETSYSLSLSHHLNDDVMLYGRIATGFKAGSFNSLAPSAESALAASKPEKAFNKEIGIKGFYFDKQVQFNLALFDIDYDDLQVFSGTESSANAPRAKISGFETEVRTKLKENVEIAANYTYLDTSFREFVTPDGTNLANKDLPRAPKHALSFSIQYSWNDDNSNNYRAEWLSSYTDRIDISPKGTEGSRVPGYHVSNMVLNWNPESSPVQYSLWAKNVFEKAYATHAVEQQTFLYTKQGSARNMAPPRTIGATLDWTLH